MNSFIMKVIIFVSIFTFLFILKVEAGYDGKTCITPNGEKSLCRKIQHCPTFYSDSYSKRFLEESLCGYEASEYKKGVKLDKVVCCGKVGYYLSYLDEEDSKIMLPDLKIDEKTIVVNGNFLQDYSKDSFINHDV